jgi:hypothetical protein
MQQELTDKWGADGTDFRLIENLARYLSSDKGNDKTQRFPGSVCDTAEYKDIMKRGDYEDGRKAKTLLAIISEFGELEGLTSSQGMGSLSGGDLGLSTMIEYVIPILVPALAVKTGYTGYSLPENIEKIKNHEQKLKGITEYTTNWIIDKMGDDPEVSHLVERQEDDLLLEMFASNEGLRVAEATGRLARGEELSEEDWDLLELVAMTDATVKKMMEEKGISNK